MKVEKARVDALLLALLSVVALSCAGIKTTLIKSVFSDSNHKKGIQTIPGKLECELYNLGGEGVAYHDTDSINSGSGRLNKGTDYLSTFRINEAVDISFTKYHDSIDNSIYNLVQPKEGLLYLGWTEPGEWTTYTVKVEKTGTYQIGLMYTANQNGEISITTDYGNSSGVIKISSTYHIDDPIDWRQWHHWNYNANLGTIALKKGIQILRLNTVAVGQMNYEHLSFKLLP